jgi:hypothetical protein
MTKLLVLILAGLSWVAATYFTFAFVCWDLNAGNWSDGARFICAMVGVFFPTIMMTRLVMI